MEVNGGWDAGKAGQRGGSKGDVRWSCMAAGMVARWAEGGDAGLVQDRDNEGDGFQGVAENGGGRVLYLFPFSFLLVEPFAMFGFLGDA